MRKGVRNKKNKETEKKQIKELKKQLARALADYDNLRKRVEREKGQWEKIASARVIVKLLSVFDMLEEAQKHIKDSGIALTLEEFERILEEEGVEKIKPKTGEKFDERFHEAVEVEEDDEEGKISGIILTGWRFIDGPVIRPAKVKVTKKR